MPSDNAVFKLPSSADFGRIARKHNLDPNQRNELEICVRQALYDLERFFVVRLDREARAAEIAEKRDFLEALNKLLAIIGKVPASFNKYLPFTIREEMALGASPELIRKLTGRSAYSWAPERKVSLKTVGLVHGTEIFADYIARVRAPLIDFFDEEDANRDRGGREPNHVRDHMLKSLVRWYVNVFGKTPTPTAKGPFVNLVIDVFHVCSIETEGLERAVERTLERWRAANVKNEAVKTP